MAHARVIFHNTKVTKYIINIGVVQVSLDVSGVIGTSSSTGAIWW